MQYPDGDVTTSFENAHHRSVACPQRDLQSTNNFSSVFNGMPNGRSYGISFFDMNMLDSRCDKWMCKCLVNVCDAFH